MEDGLKSRMREICKSGSVKMEQAVPVKEQTQFCSRGGRDLLGDSGILLGCGCRGRLDDGRLVGGRGVRLGIDGR